jgi:AcrR family transcriptional regulator
MNVKTGGVEKVEAGVKPRVRDRIFETASDLFYRHGIRAVGVDAIANEAGTNKMSFYRAFPSKDDLVAEYLHDQEREYFGWWDQAIARHAGDPRRQIEVLFDSYLDLARLKPKGDCGGACKTSRGCALGNAAVEIPEGNELLGGIVHEYKTEIRRRLHKLAREAGAREPDTLGDALMLLMEGGYYSRLTFPHNSGPIAAIAKAARTLVDAAIDDEAHARKAR